MMHQQANTLRQTPPPVGDSAFQRVHVDLHGRLMLENYSEFDCRVAEMSPGDARLVSNALPQHGERIIAYADHLGRIEGRVVAIEEDMAFVISLNATERKREKLAAQLTWLANKHELNLPEDRRDERHEPNKGVSELTLDDGRTYPCRIIDLSLSGAAIDLEVRPAIGTPVQLGHMRGRVVRQFLEGIAIEFLARQTEESIRGIL